MLTLIVETLIILHVIPPLATLLSNLFDTSLTFALHESHDDQNNFPNQEST